MGDPRPSSTSVGHHDSMIEGGVALEGAAAGVVRALGQRGWTLAVAESLTGGLVASSLVSVPGASAVFRGGLVVYATDLKHALAGVPTDLLADRGPVDPDVARALAGGARLRCAADWGLATTGVAGPDPQDGKPVGLVYVAVAGPGDTRVRGLQLDGSRAQIRSATVLAAFDLLHEQLTSDTPGQPGHLGQDGPGPGS